MARIISRVAVALLVLVLLVAAAIATVPLWADLEQVKQYAARAVQDATGKELVLGGELEVSLFPWLGVEARDVALVDPGSGAPLAATERARIQVRLLALLERRIEADTVTLEDLAVNVIRFADGTTNWDLPAGEGQARAAGDGPALAYTLAGVNVDNATVTLDDRATGQRIEVRDVAIETGAISPGDPVAVNLSGIATGIPQLRSAAFSLQSRLQPGAGGLRAEVERLALKLEQVDAQGATAVLDVQASAALTWDQGTLRLDTPLLSASGRVPALGLNRIDARLNADAARWQGDGVTTEALVLEGDASYGAPPVSTGFSLSGDLEAALDGPVIRLRGARLALRDMAAEALRIAGGRLALEGDLVLDQAAGKAEVTALAVTGDITTAGPAATTRFSTEGGRLEADLASGDVTLETAAVLFNAAAPALGVQSIEGRMAGPLRLSPEVASVPALSADLVLAGADQSPANVRGTVAVKTGLTFHQGQGLLRLGDLDTRFDVNEPARGIAAKGSLGGGIAVTLAGPAVAVAGLAVDATVSARGLEKPLPLKLKGDVNADLGTQTLAAEGITLSTLGIEGKASLKGEAIIDAPRWSGALVTNRFDPSRALAGLGTELPALADQQALKSLQLQGAFSAGPGAAAIQTLDLRLDQSRIRGSLDARFADVTRVTFDLDIDRLNVDRYMPVAAPGSAEQATAVEAGAALVPLLPKDLEVAGPLTIGDLRFQNMHTTRVKADLALAGGVLKVAPLEAAMYGGEVTQRIVLDTAAATPRASFAMDARGIRVGELLADLQGRERVTGTGTVVVALESAGGDDLRMLANLDGRGSFDLRDGAVKGINVAQLIRRAESVISGKPLPADQSLETDFTELTGSFRIEDGVVKNDDLRAKSPLLRVQGRGSANLVTRRIDYELDTALVDTTEGQGGRGVEELGDVTIPITFGGTFTKPTYSLDPGRLLAEKAKQEVKRQLEKKLKKEAGDKIEDQLKQKLLEGLFGR